MDYTRYLEEIGISNEAKTRVDDIIKYYQNILRNTELDDIFICDYLTEDGNRNYTSLWMKFGESICEAKNFLKENDFDLTSIKKEKIKYWNIKTKNIETDSFGDNSRLSIDISLIQEVILQLKAAKNNCKYLMEFIKKNII